MSASQGNILFFGITVVICFAVVGAVIYLVNTSRPPEKKISMFPGLVLAVALSVGFWFVYWLYMTSRR